MKESILCAAIWFNDNCKYVHQPVNVETGYVICGHRHHNCYTTLRVASKRRRTQMETQNQQGFITNTNRFVSRQEAAKIAFDAGQTSELKQKLFSEDLY